MPAVSVVIPLYNKALEIRRAVESVLAQSWQDFEIIVIDDGSTDGGAEVVKSISEPRLRLIRQENAGVSAARNRGIAEATSELIAFLDADDVWKPKFLETILRLRKRFPEAGAYATAYEVHESNGKVIQLQYKDIPSPPWEGLIPNYFRSALGSPPVWSSAVAVPKGVFEDVGCFPVGEPIGEDGDMWLRIALKYPIAFSWQIGATYFKDVDKWSNPSHPTQSTLKVLKTAKEAIRKGEVPPSLLPDFQEYIAKHTLHNAAWYVLMGKPKIARQLLADCKTKLFYKTKLWWFWWAIMPARVPCFARSMKKEFTKRMKSILPKCSQRMLKHKKIT
ncbi:MAG: glycosyltransferase family 2 protein [bacterium]|nr:glycosyltransferase family 2 protein [bacterium]